MRILGLGGSGLKVSELWLGSMMFGHRTDAGEAARIVDDARAAGVNAIDTADVYANGESERIVGKLVAKDRERWVIASKLCNPMGEDPNRRGLSRRWMMRAIDESLARLGTDWIDLYYLHKEDPTTPLEETIDAMADLIRAGKVRYFGLSNFRAWRAARVAEICRSRGLPAPIAIQPPYNLMTRGIEAEVIPCAVHYGMGVLAYSPLARGVLTGKYKPAAPPPPDSRASIADKRLMETEFRPESLRITEDVAAYLATSNRSLPAFALRWVLANAYVNGVIAGPRTLAQWQGYVAALATPYGPEDDAFVDRLVAPGHASTHGYTDPAYPVGGRAFRA